MDSLARIPLSLFLFVAFFLMTFTYIFRRDVVFSMFYLLLFVYTIFTETANLCFPEILARQGIPLGDALDWEGYNFFVRSSFIVIFLTYLSAYDALKGLRFGIHRTRLKSVHAFCMLVACYDLVLIYLYWSNAQDLSYAQQSSLKENGLFRNMYALSPSVLIIIWHVMRAAGDGLKRNVVAALLAVHAFVLALIISKTGQREVFLTVPIGLFVYSYMTAPKRKRVARYWLKVFVVLLVAGYVGIAVQVVRREEMSLLTLASALSQPGVLMDDFLFSPTGLLFQDYTGPSLVLLYSIQSGFTDFSEGLESVLLGSVPLSGQPSLGSIVAREINPAREYEWQGFGYYFLHEGYFICGWWGVLYNGLVFTLGYFFWKKLFIDVKDVRLKALFGALIAMQAIEIVRGQSSNFIRNTLFILIPSLILNLVATGAAPGYFKRRTAGAAAGDCRERMGSAV